MEKLSFFFCNKLCVLMFFSLRVSRFVCEINHGKKEHSKNNFVNDLNNKEINLEINLYVTVYLFVCSQHNDLTKTRIF